MRTFTLLTLSFAFGATSALACPGQENAAHASTATPVAADADVAQASIEISGMKCGSCAGKIASTLTGIDGVQTATVDAQAGTATVSYDKSKVGVDALVQAVADMGEGYKASSIEPALNN